MQFGLSSPGLRPARPPRPAATAGSVPQPVAGRPAPAVCSGPCPTRSPPGTGPRPSCRPARTGASTRPGGGGCSSGCRTTACTPAACTRPSGTGWPASASCPTPGWPRWRRSSAGPAGRTSSGPTWTASPLDPVGLTGARLRAVARPLAAAVDTLHARGLVHGAITRRQRDRHPGRAGVADPPEPLPVGRPGRGRGGRRRAARAGRGGGRADRSLGEWTTPGRPADAGRGGRRVPTPFARAAAAGRPGRRPPAAVAAGAVRGRRVRRPPPLTGPTQSQGAGLVRSPLPVRRSRGPSSATLRLPCRRGRFRRRALYKIPVPPDSGGPSGASVPGRWHEERSHAASDMVCTRPPRGGPPPAGRAGGRGRGRAGPVGPRRRRRPVGGGDRPPAAGDDVRRADGRRVAAGLDRADRSRPRCGPGRTGPSSRGGCCRSSPGGSRRWPPGSRSWPC